MATAAFYTLGCKVNQTETAALEELYSVVVIAWSVLKSMPMFM